MIAVGIVESACAALRNKQPVGGSPRLIDAATQEAAKLKRNVAMVSISRSMLLAASLVAFPLAGAMAQHDASGDGKPAGPGSASGSGNKAVVSNNGGDAMKSTAPGYQSKSAVSDAVGNSSGNAASGKSGKQPQ
jgi:hypothetical protein